MSISNRRHKDCLPCRLVSGVGVLVMGIYLWTQARKRTQLISRYAMYGIASAAGGIGVTRLLDVYPFGEATERKE